jgi:hypothetical protein
MFAMMFITLSLFTICYRGTAKNLAPLVFSIPNFSFLPEGRGFINALHVIFLTPFLHNEVLRKLDFLPIGFLELPIIFRDVLHYKSISA